MEPEQNGAAFAGMSRHHRSAVTNRTKLFAIEGMDGRLGPARRFRDILEQIWHVFYPSLRKSETKFQRAPERFNFTADWFCHNEWNFIKYLAHLIDTPCRILEIGCYEGRATVWMLENIATHPDATIKCIDCVEQASFRQNILAARSPEKVRLEIGFSRNLLRSYPTEHFRFCLR